jgi:hypothetical protein
MASHNSQYHFDAPQLSVMSSPGTAPEASAQWFAGAFPVESMLMPRQEYRPFGLDRDEPGPEDLA